LHAFEAAKFDLERIQTLIDARQFSHRAMVSASQLPIHPMLQSR